MLNRCVAIGFALILPAFSQSVTHQISLPAGKTWCSDAMINGLFTTINTYRSQNGAAPLAWSPLGARDAELRAVQFADYMATHTPGSAGFNPHQGWDTTAASIGYQAVSENLAFSTSDPTYIVYSVWQDSLHRAAMLATDANVAGVSCVVYNGIPYWTYEPGIGTNTGGGGGAPTLDSEQWAFLTALNSFRAQRGAGPVKVSATLQNAAMWMSNDMATHSNPSHVDSLGRSPGARIAAFGYTYVPWGENIAGGYGDAQTVLNQWANACDPDATGACTYAHRVTMLNPSFKAIGIGRVYNGNSAYGWYWTTDFGGVLDQEVVQPGTGGGGVGNAPAIGYFNASPSTISQGQSTTLSWSVTGATTVSIDQGVGAVNSSGTLTAAPGSTTTYRMTASNASGSVTAAVTVAVAPANTGDTQPPTAPVLTASLRGGTQVDLAWTAGTDNVGVAGYQILRNGSALAAANAATRTYTDNGTPGGQYSYSIRAYDAAGNYSTASNAVLITMPSTPSGTVCPQPADNAFTGCYYNNLTMTGSPTLVRVDPQINFDWQTSPSPAVTPMNFSVRWEGNFSFSDGLYNFTAIASDGIRVYLDGGLIFDRWRDQAQMTFSFRQFIAAGTHRLTIEYYEHSGSPTAHLSWQNSSQPAPGGSAPVISAFLATPAAIAAGQSTTLTWTVSGATTLEVDNGGGVVTGRTSLAVSPQQTVTYRLAATNSWGSSSATATVTVSGAGGQDTQAPTVPAMAGLSLVNGTAVSVSWSGSTDNTAVAGYQVIRNGTAIGSAGAQARSYLDSTTAPGNTYSYGIRAFDAAGNYSSQSSTQSIAVPSTPAGGSCPGPASGAFTGCYYNNPGMTGNPAYIRSDAEINFDWQGAPSPLLSPTGYSVRWEGNFAFADALYNFTATTSDGIRVYLDGVLIFDRWRDQPPMTYRFREFISPGTHKVTVEYYQRSGTPTVHLTWQRN